MKSLFSLTAVHIVLAYSAALSGAATPSAVVYESLMDPAGGGSAFHGGILEIGQSITLQGPERYVTQIDLLLGDNASDDFRVRFYGIDANSGQPSTVIWESPIQTYPFEPPHFNWKVISLSVPMVRVPSPMAYTIVPVAPGDSTNLIAATGTLFPSVGTHESYWVRRLDAAWHPELFSNGTLGVRLVAALPEPAAFATVAILLATMGTVRRRRIHAHA